MLVFIFIFKHLRKGVGGAVSCHLFPGPPCWSSTETSGEVNPCFPLSSRISVGLVPCSSLFKHISEGGLVQTGISHPTDNVASVSCCFITHYQKLILSSKPWGSLFFSCFFYSFKVVLPYRFSKEKPGSGGQWLVRDVFLRCGFVSKPVGFAGRGSCWVLLCDLMDWK